MSSKLQNITVLGATGSIGVSTLDVIRRHPDRYRAFALCAHSQADKLFEQCVEFRPRFAVLRDASLAEKLAERCRSVGLDTEVRHGVEALIELSSLPEVDAVMAAIVGAAGLEPTLAAARAGKKVMLANKEVLVMAGELFMHAVREHGATLLPVDSEHNAIFQSLPVDFARGLESCGVQKILLTASGGPFRNSPLADLANVTPDQACAHPNWVMGRKISVDSATMMNKGLEVIEAHWLFAAPPEMIQVVVHAAERYSFGGPVCGWFGAGTVGQSRYAHPDCLFNGLARAYRCRCRTARPIQDCPPRFFCAGFRAFPLSATGLRRSTRRRYGAGHSQCSQ